MLKIYRIRKTMVTKFILCITNPHRCHLQHSNRRLAELARWTGGTILVPLPCRSYLLAVHFLLLASRPCPRVVRFLLLTYRRCPQAVHFSLLGPRLFPRTYPCFIILDAQQYCESVRGFIILSTLLCHRLGI